MNKMYIQKTKAIIKEKKEKCISIYDDVKRIKLRIQNLVWAIEEGVAETPDTLRKVYANSDMDNADKNERICEKIEQILSLKKDISEVRKIIGSMDIVYGHLAGNNCEPESIKMVNANQLASAAKRIKKADELIKIISDKLENYLDD